MVDAGVIEEQAAHARVNRRFIGVERGFDLDVLNDHVLDCLDICALDRHGERLAAQLSILKCLPACAYVRSDLMKGRTMSAKKFRLPSPAEMAILELLAEKEMYGLELIGHSSRFRLTRASVYTVLARMQHKGLIYLTPS